jgi:uncharacterized Zn-finger protein
MAPYCVVILPENPMPIDAPETEVVSTWKVACDGGEGALGHPRVWLSIPEDKGWVECGYCDKRYVHESTPAQVK